MLTADRNTFYQDGVELLVPVAAGQKIFFGAIVCANASGLAVKGSTALNLRYLGCSREYVDNTNGGNGAKFARVWIDRAFQFKNDATDPVTQAALGKLCYIVDDEAVAIDDGTGTRSPAGIVIGLDSAGVWVKGRTLDAYAVSDGSVTAAKLADAVADLIADFSIAIVDDAGGNGIVTIQLKDAQGNNLAKRALINLSFSATAYGASTDLGSVAATTGTILHPIITDGLLMVQTDAAGLAVIAYDKTATGALHAMAFVGALSKTANATITVA